MPKSTTASASLTTASDGTVWATPAVGAGVERLLATGFDAPVIDDTYLLDWHDTYTGGAYTIYVSAGFKALQLGDTPDWSFDLLAPQVQRKLVSLRDGLSFSLPSGFYTIQWQRTNPIEPPGELVVVYVE